MLGRPSKLTGNLVLTLCPQKRLPELSHAHSAGRKTHLHGFGCFHHQERPGSPRPWAPVLASLHLKPNTCLRSPGPSHSACMACIPFLRVSPSMGPKPFTLATCPCLSFIILPPVNQQASSLLSGPFLSGPKQFLRPSPSCFHASRQHSCPVFERPGDHSPLWLAPNLHRHSWKNSSGSHCPHATWIIAALAWKPLGFLIPLCCLNRLSVCVSVFLSVSVSVCLCCALCICVPVCLWGLLCVCVSVCVCCVYCVLVCLCACVVYCVSVCLCVCGVYCVCVYVSIMFIVYFMSVVYICVLCVCSVYCVSVSVCLCICVH